MQGPLVERDAYVLGPDDSLNVKVRFRTRSLKVKELVESADDGFELWRTETDARLPAPPQTWAEVAARISLELDPYAMATLRGPGEVARALCVRAGTTRCVEVAKERTSSILPRARVEVAEVVVAGAVFHSVAFESTSLELARSLRSQLAGPELGPPENYVSFCSRSAAGELRPPASP